MPVRIHDAGRLTDLRGDQRQLFYRQPENVNLDMECIVRAEFGDDTARQDIAVLEALENASDCARISVGNDPKST
jgi:hypothetical protein